MDDVDVGLRCGEDSQSLHTKNVYETLVELDCV